MLLPFLVFSGSVYIVATAGVGVGVGLGLGGGVGCAGWVGLGGGEDWCVGSGGCSGWVGEEWADWVRGDVACGGVVWASFKLWHAARYGRGPDDRKRTPHPTKTFTRRCLRQMFLQPSWQKQHMSVDLFSFSLGLY